MSGTMTSLLIVESVLTAAAILMFLYRGILDMKEEDHLILDDAESHLAREQAGIRRKVAVITRYLRVVSVTWGILLIVIMGVWVMVTLG